jgi:hypothetical protein
MAVSTISLEKAAVDDRAKPLTIATVDKIRVVGFMK